MLGKVDSITLYPMDSITLYPQAPPSNLQEFPSLDLATLPPPPASLVARGYLATLVSTHARFILMEHLQMASERLHVLFLQAAPVIGSS